MTEKELSVAEAELYDRQIRLWGIESQEKLRAANVLLIGVRALGSEIAKNILLCGINSLTILDDRVVSEEDLLHNFLLSKQSLDKNIAEAVSLKAQLLNPLVKLVTDPGSVSLKPEEYYRNFTIVIVTELQTELLVSISNTCRKSGIKFVCGDVFGMFGYALSDFQEHEFYEDRVQLAQGKKRKHSGKEEKTTVKIHHKFTYPELRDVFSFPEKEKLKPGKRRNPLYYLVKVLLKFRDEYGRSPKYAHKDEDILHLKMLKKKVLNVYDVNEERLKDEVLSLLFDTVVPVCSIVGGVIAQEVIKAVSQKEVPINNLFLLDPFTHSGNEEKVEY